MAPRLRAAQIRPMPPVPLVLDDFTRADGLAANGQPWRGFSDRVMGGISREQVSREVLDGRPCVRLRGQVRLENNGGFVQVALPLDPGGQPLDASAWDAVELLVRGNGEAYYVHLRTTDTRAPWAYYRASFVAEPAWRPVRLPFASFAPVASRLPLDPRRLTRLGVVAYGKPFTADVAVARVALT